MSESLWNRPGEALSHKNACKEFGLTEDEVFEAIKSGQTHTFLHTSPAVRLP